MRSFTDNQGRKWLLEVHVGVIKRIKAMTGVHLPSLLDDGCAGLGKLLSDPVLLVDVLYVLCKEQADQAGMTDEQFGRGLVGDSLEQASYEFVEALADFFPNARARDLIRKILKAGREAADELISEIQTKLDGVDVQSEVRRWIESSSRSQGDSESIPTL